MLKSHSETTKIVRHIGNLLKCYIPCQERLRISEKLCPKATPMRRKKNGEYLLKILQNVRFLARQDLVLRDDGSEENSNFVQLLRLRAEDDAFIKEMINKKTDKYTSADIRMRC